MIDMIIGGIAAIACMGLIRFLFREKEIFVWRIGIIIAALVYVGFVIRGGAWEFFSMELAGVLMYSTLAWLSFKYNTYWLALAWALHIGWDVLLHDPVTTAYVPVWYPASCIGFDIMIACYVLGRQFFDRSIKVA